MRSYMSSISLLWAICLSMAALAIPPQGVIDASVLVLLAQVLVFAATMAGVSLPKGFGKRENA